ncbi:MAG: transglycosylase SLT domain-containing protein [Alphaproteobacteria bacterium]|nr:transglycosylase SLT domain-containing protein [Alphaproteobacteria bacterium]
MSFKFRTLILAAATIAIGFVSMPVNAYQGTVFNETICRKHTNQQERLNHIPKNLLTAISIAESGRWDKEKKEIIAWPWTVTAKGKGNYYPSKSTAIRAVKELKAQGIKNIDVGCMQINLYYHPDAFDSLDEAFDPQSNAEYSASFLKRLFKSNGSWNQATAYYHSGTPEKGMRYKERVLGLWNEIQHDEPAVQSARVEEKSNPYIVPVDFDRSTLVNKFMKSRQARATVERQKSKIGEHLKALRGSSSPTTAYKKKGRGLQEYRKMKVPKFRKRI